MQRWGVVVVVVVVMVVVVVVVEVLAINFEPFCPDDTNLRSRPSTFDLEPFCLDGTNNLSPTCFLC